jgi:hypothetical protein
MSTLTSGAEAGLERPASIATSAMAGVASPLTDNIP